MMAVVREKSITPIPDSHDDLAHDLAMHVNNGNVPTWENIKLRNCRPDVFTVKPTYNLNQVRTTTFEIKISRSDFLSDINKDKWRKYTAFSNYVYFACPDGLISIDELPDGCGLYYRKSHGWQRQIKIEKGYNSIIEKNFGGELSMKDWIKLAIGKWEK